LKGPVNIPSHVRTTSFVNLPVSATEDRVVGTLDIEQAIQKGERHFEPGVLASPTAGLLYIDEVNLLDDHVVDVLLDSAAMGVNMVEREGISFSHPARFILVGTMNPEEGELRPQLLDRFALSVDIVGIREARERVLIMERNLAFEQDAESFRNTFMPKELDLSHQDRTGARTRRAGDAHQPRPAVHRRVDRLPECGRSPRRPGHPESRARPGRVRRADEDQRSRYCPGRRAGAPPPHQADSLPTGRDDDRAAAGTHRAAGRSIGPERSRGGVRGAAGPTRGKKNLKLEDEREEGPQEGKPEQMPQDVFANTSANWWEGGQKVKPGEKFQPRKLNTPLDKLARKHAGSRSLTKTERKHGRYIKARPAGEKKDDIAFDATFRAAAPFQKQRVEQRKRLAFAIEKSDLQRKIRVKRVANLVLFLVDASWSMAVAERMNATKGAILSLLTDAYQRRDRVGLIVFQKDRATLVLPPTNSVQLAQRALMDIPVGGKTPLSAGLFLAADVLRQEKTHHPDIEPLLDCINRWSGNVSIGALPPQEESYRFAELIAHEKIKSIVINMEHAAFDQGLAQQLANHLKAPCYALSELKAENLYHTVKEEMARPMKK
jgi:magnesium chelatase subunit D